MVGRLRGAMESGQRVTGADASFYIHELAESTMMARGLPYAQAHAATLSKYGVSPYSVYHPEVISKYPEMFGSPWKQFWGIG
jgi:hypothetical protein